MFFIELSLFFYLHFLTNLSFFGIQNAFVAHKSLRAKIVVATILSCRLKLVYIKYLYINIYIFVKAELALLEISLNPPNTQRKFRIQFRRCLSRCLPCGQGVQRCVCVCVCINMCVTMSAVCVCVCWTSFADWNAVKKAIEMRTATKVVPQKPK